MYRWEFVSVYVCLCERVCLFVFVRGHLCEKMIIFLSLFYQNLSNKIRTNAIKLYQIGLFQILPNAPYIQILPNAPYIL